MALQVQQSETLAIRASNLALLKIGVSKTITSLSEQSREAMTAALQFDHQFRACLRQFPWAFATKYKNLGLVGGSASVAINGDWQYAYEYPDDCLFARRIVPPGSTGTDLFGVVTATGGGVAAGATGREFRETPPGPGRRSEPVPFRVGREGDLLVVYSNANQVQDDGTGTVVPAVCLEYTAIFSCPEEIVDELFMDALSWRMASAMAPSLSRVQGMANRAWAMYLNTIDTASAVGSKEGQLEANGEAEWIRARS